MPLDDLQLLQDKQPIPLGALDQILTFQALDEVYQESPFEVIFETHSKSQRETILKLIQKTQEHRDNSRKNWIAGNFDQCLADSKTAFDVLVRETKIREEDMIEDLKHRLRRLLQEKDDSLIFLPLGVGHSSIVQAIKRKIGLRAPIKFITKIATDFEESPKILLKLRNQEPVPDEFYAQDVLGRLVRSYLIDYLIVNGRLNSFAENYETIDSVISLIITATSLEEICRMCEEKQDVLEFLRNHPITSFFRNI